ncbi:MAG: hypothetical protein ACRELD_02095 [Longimicrobiales bacterium]
MHITLTDILTCPRCGPEAGLILLAERLEERRVSEGRLGCARCRSEYGIARGIVDLRPAAGVVEGAGGASAPVQRGEADGSLRLAALLGLEAGQGRGAIVVTGPASAYAGALAELAGAEVVVIGAETGEAAGVSQLRTAGGLPFKGRSVAGVVLSGTGAAALIEEGARVLVPLGRLLVENVAAGAADRARAAGLDVLAEEGGTVLAARMTRA